LFCAYFLEQIKAWSATFIQTRLSSIWMFTIGKIKFGVALFTTAIVIMDIQSMSASEMNTNA